MPQWSRYQVNKTSPLYIISQCSLMWILHHGTGKIHDWFTEPVQQVQWINRWTFGHAPSDGCFFDHLQVQTKHLTSIQTFQGDHLSGKPGNVREFSGKNLVIENCPTEGLQMTAVDLDCYWQCTLVHVEYLTCVSYVVEMRTEDCVTYNLHYSIGVDGSGFYDVIIMKSLSLNMNLTVWSLTLTLVVQT